jgi:hypothetical protein
MGMQAAVEARGEAMGDDRKPDEAERAEEPLEDLDVAPDDADAVKGGAPVSNTQQTQDAIAKGYIQNTRP